MTTTPIRHALVLLLAAGAAYAQVPVVDDAGRAARVQAQLSEIDKVYAELAAREHLPGLVYGVVLDGKLVHQRALGLANVEDSIAATSTTRFRIASMTKSFTALAILKLRDQGKLRLDDPVASYLPEVAKVRLPTADSQPLSLRMLMTMTTGLPEDNPWGDRQMTLSNDALANLIAGGLSFSNAPGHEFEYSNLGYMMLGKVVSKVAGMRFQDYITREIFLPLGMRDTSWEYTTIPAAQLALGYIWNGKGWEREPMLRDGDAAAMGGLITTMQDFARYVAFHLDAWPARDGADTGPVRRSTVREMHTPHVFSAFDAKATLVDRVTPNPNASFYGYGMTWTRDSRGTVMVGHAGGLPGFGSNYRFAPHHGIGVIALSNLRYGRVYKPTAAVLKDVIERASLPARTVATSAILARRQPQVLRLIQSWDEALGRAITADNFFLDRARAEWITHAGTRLAKIGKIVSIGALVPENRLRGAFPIVGEQGTLTVAFTLTPEKEPRMQDLTMDVAAPPPVDVLVREGGYVAMGREFATVDELFKMLTERGIKKIAMQRPAEGYYKEVGALIYRAQRLHVELLFPEPE